MTEIVENKDNEKNDLQNAVEKTASKRAGFTRGFLEKNNKPIAEFAEELKKKPFEITINPDDDKSLALGVFQLQKKLGFSEEDNSQGCDGKFGPYTKRAFEGRGVENRGSSARAAVMDDVDPGGPPEEKAPQPRDDRVEKTSELETVKTSETAFVGDSLTVGMARTKGLDGSSKLYKGAASTTGRLPILLNFLRDNKVAIEQKQIKKVVIFLGTNDITNFNGKLDSVESINGRLAKMFANAREAGLTVVACTIAYSDLGKRVAYWKKVHGDKYPYSVGDLEKRVNQVNDFIRSQSGNNVKVVDVYKETLDQKKYALSGDGLHFTPSGYKALAKLIKSGGGVKD